MKYSKFRQKYGRISPFIRLLKKYMVYFVAKAGFGGSAGAKAAVNLRTASDAPGADAEF